MKKLVVIIAALLLNVVVMPLFGSSTAHAYSNSRLMDDGIFDNVNSMNEPQIQSFLASKGPCLANYQDVDSNWNGTTWTYGGSVPASHIIAKAAAQWGLNPQVIITTLQKEESLITGTACDGWRYNSAMGYACPDSGGCNPKYAGFSRQVLWGSWQLKFNKERSVGNLAWDGDGDIPYVGFMTQGTFQRQNGGPAQYYDGIASIDGKQVFMENGTTASLYTYTPHLGQSFPSIFEGWFGPAVVTDPNPPVAIYRLLNPWNNNHLYTISTQERDSAVKQGFKYEGLAFYDYAGSGPGIVGVYRLYSPVLQGHMYTADPAERDAAVSQYGFTYEGVAFTAYSGNSAPGLTPVYRLRNASIGKYLYTTSISERDGASSRFGYAYEGISWYAAQ